MAVRCIAFGGVVYNIVVGMTRQEYNKHYYQLHRKRILERSRNRYWEKKGDISKQAECKARRKSRYDKRYREENRAYWRWYYRENKERLSEYSKEYYKKNADRLKEHARANYQKAKNGGRKGKAQGVR